MARSSPNTRSQVGMARTRDADLKVSVPTFLDYQAILTASSACRPMFGGMLLMNIWFAGAGSSTILFSMGSSVLPIPFASRPSLVFRTSFGSAGKSRIRSRDPEPTTGTYRWHRSSPRPMFPFLIRQCIFERQELARASTRSASTAAWPRPRRTFR